MDIHHATARLVIREGSNSRTVDIETLPFTIGRQPAASLFLPDPQVSRAHAVIEHAPGGEGFLLRDTGSRHGTFVNGVRQESVSLNPGDHIQLGASPISLLFVAPEDRASTRTLLARLSSSEGSGSELEKLSLLLQAAQSFNNARALEEVLATMIEYTLRVTGAERGFVFLTAENEEDPSNLRLAAGLSSTGEHLVDDSRISRSVLRDAVAGGQEYFLGDVSGDGKPIGRESMVVHDIRSVIAIPLRARNAVSLLGLLYLDSHLRSGTLNRVGRDILHAIANEAATLVENARMVQAQRAAELIKNELNIAASIQQSIMARELPTFPYARIDARSVPSTEVGGDFFDIISLPDDQGIPQGFVAIVADVSGKGMSAALLASIVQGMMYAQILGGAPLIETVKAVNSFLCSRVSGRKYVTLVAAHYRPDGSVTLVNGGHVSPYLVRPIDAQPAGTEPCPRCTVEKIVDGDVPVGLFSAAGFHTVNLQIPPSGRLVLISDGLTEAEDPAGDQFDGHIEHELSSPDPIGSIFTAVDRFCQGAPPHDDRTLLVIDRL